LLIAVVVAALVLVGGTGFPGTRPRLLSGAAWLPSAAVGQLTLLDGATVEVAAQVKVASPGSKLDAVQQGADAYAVNRTAGTLRRVDGATMTAGETVSPLPGAGDGLRAVAGPGTLYALDVNRGAMVGVDAGTQQNLGAPVGLAAQLSPDGVVLDGAGRLWVLDAASGQLTWLDRGVRHVQRAATAPGAGQLSIAGGSVVLVDTVARTASRLDPTDGGLLSTTRLDLRDGERVRAVGALHDQRLFVVASRGALAVCELVSEDCPTVVPFAEPGADLGSPVESGGMVFVPDYSTGQVWVIDLGRAVVVARPKVLDAKVRFQLLSHDSVVFFNDPDSEKAGVIRLDGGVRHVAKYDPRDPNGGPVGSSTPTPSTTPSTTQPTPTTPGTTPKVVPTTTPPITKPSSNPPPRVTAQIVASTTAPTVGQDVTFRLSVPGGQTPIAVRWTFGDGQSAEGTRTTHRWATQQTFQVSVTATFSGGRTAVATATIQVLKAPIQVNVDLVAVKGAYNGVCDPPADATTYQATISVTDGPVTVRYKIRNSGNRGSDTAVKTLTFAGTGPQSQTVTHRESAYPPGFAVDSWLAVDISAPVVKQSARVPYRIKCTGPNISLGPVWGNGSLVGKCPLSFDQMYTQFDAFLNAGDRPITVAYRWERLDGPSSDPSLHTVQLTPANSSVEVFHKETFDYPPGTKKDGKVVVRVISPVPFVHAVEGDYTIECT
jgi:hypothetical protein